MKLNLSLIEPAAIGDGSPVTRTPGVACTYYDKNGLRKQVTDGSLRITYDPADLSAAPYPLIEPTPCLQMLGYTNTFSVAGWSAFQATVTNGAAIGPDGTMSASRFANAGAAEQSLKAVASSYVAGQKYTGAVSAAAGEVSTLQAVVSTSVADLGSGGSGVLFDLVNGTFSTWGTVVSADMSQEANGFWRCEWYFTATATVTTVGGYWLNLGMAANDPSKGLYIADPDLTPTASGVAHIPNTGAPGSVTRPADVLGPNAGLIFSTLTENDTDDAPLYDPAHTYATGERVRRAETHRVYESNVAGNLGNTPELNATGDAAKWLDVRPTNRWAMFDGDTSTQSAAASTLTVVLRPGAINALYGAGIDADLVQVCVQDAPGGNIILNDSEALEASTPGDYDEYFWGRFKPKTDFLVTGVDQYHQCVVTVTLTKTAGTVKCGVLLAGDQIPLAASQRGAKAKPRSYSYIKTDDFGNTTIKRRRATTDLSGTAWVERAEASWVEGVIQRVLDVPVVVIVSDDAQDYGLRGYGLLSAEISWDQPQDCLLSFSLQGLINATTDSAA